MAYTPISGIVPQLSRNAGGAAASGYYLKGYEAGTTTPLSMGIDSTPTATLAKCKLNTRGEPISNDADETTVFIPHYNESYKLALYVNETDADNNTTANAVWVVDNITGQIDASQIALTVNSLSRTSVESYLENQQVPDYATLIANAAQYSDGDAVMVTGERIAGEFVVLDSPAHGLTSTRGIVVALSDDRLAVRRFVGRKHLAWWEPNNDNTADALPEIQEFIDSAGSLFWDKGNYRIDDSIRLKKSLDLIGETGDGVNSIRNVVRISPSGNFPAFTNDDTVGVYERNEQYRIKGFEIFWEQSTPLASESATKGNRYGIYFTKKDPAVPWTAPFSYFEDIEVTGCWYVFFDDTDNYFNTLTRVTGRFNRFGHYKRLGTMFTWRNCNSSIGAQAFHLENTISPRLEMCSADECTPDASTPGNTAIYVYNADGFGIHGMDAEASDIIGAGYSYCRIRSSTGTISDWTGLNQILSLPPGSTSVVSYFAVGDASNVTISGFKQTFLGNNTLTYAGADGLGSCATLWVTGGSKATVIGSDLLAPSGGIPATRYSAFGNSGSVRLIGTDTDETEAGVVFKEDDGALSIKSAQIDDQLTVDRNSADGSIIELTKDDVNVGDVGVFNSDRLFFGSINTGFCFIDGSDTIVPFNPDGLVNRDNAIDLGTGSARYKEIYASNGTINTSDEREKTDWKDLQEAEKAVALEIKAAIKKYRWIAQKDELGSEAKHSIGVGAQTVQAIFAEHGLDPLSYDLLRYDEWSEEVNADGVVIQEAGSRYGIKMDQLAMFILSAL